MSKQYYSIADLARELGWTHQKLWWEINLHRRIPGPEHVPFRKRKYYTAGEADEIKARYRK